MSRRLLWIFVVLGLIGPALPAQAQIPFARELVPTRTALSRLGLERRWSGIVPLGDITERVLLISLADNMLFAQTNKANFHAYEAESGQYLWGVNLGMPTLDAAPASVNSDRVFVSNSKTLFCLDRGTGRTVWEVPIPELPSSSTACDENLAMVGMRDGMLAAFNIRDHPELRPPARRASMNRWNWKTDGVLSGRPITADRVVAFASQDSRVYVALIDKKLLLYRYLTGGPISASMGTYTEPNTYNYSLLVPSEDNNLYSIDLYTGATRWVYSSGAPIKQEPLVTGGIAYIVNAQGIMSAINAQTGDLLWTLPTGDTELLALGRNRVYLRSADDDLLIVDRSNGRLLAGPRQTFERAGLNLRAYTIAPTNSVNDRMYLVTPSGFLICLSEAGVTKPVPLRGPEARPFGYLPPEGLPEEVTTPPPGTEDVNANDSDNDIFGNDDMNQP